MAKILVCDDDKEIVEAIEIYLTQDGQGKDTKAYILCYHRCYF